MAEEKAVVYARYSSHNQTEQSIEGQLAAARKYDGKNGEAVFLLRHLSNQSISYGRNF